MTVSELIDRLREYPPDYEVWCDEVNAIDGEGGWVREPEPHRGAGPMVVVL